MMVGGGEGSHSRRKSLDAEDNLVPFIDLLSMCICFLMTAVWIQISSVQVKQSKGTEAAATPSNSYEMDLKFSGTTSIDVTIKKNGKAVNKVSAVAETTQALAQVLDSKIKAIISSLGSSAKVSAAMVTPKEGVSYGELVDVLDTLRKNQIINLGVFPVGGR
jgi:biopolymer transport protein ExbD